MKKDISLKLVELQTVNYFNPKVDKSYLDELIVKYQMIEEILEITKDLHVKKISSCSQELNYEVNKCLKQL